VKHVKTVKILAIASSGAHIDYLVAVLPAFTGATVELATFRTPWTSDLSGLPFSRIYRVFLWETLSWFTIYSTMIAAFFQAFWILAQSKPQVVFSTGAELSIPFFIIGYFIPGIKLIHLETASRPNKPCLSGRILMRLCDSFFVQWPSQQERYKKYSVYKGRVF
jgi:UDP-N-acetylglucosamine:LPS N-acetylglucosamine transferase